MATDLFGNPISDESTLVRVARHVPKGKEWKGGYAARPGGGPVGETCRSCLHYGHGGGGARRWPKCELMRHAWTHGPGSDIKAKSPACDRWQEKLKAAVEL